MRPVEPKVHLIARPSVYWGAVRTYLRTVGGEEWMDRVEGSGSDGERLVEFMGRICYRS